MKSTLKEKDLTLPRYLRRALESGNEDRVEACLDKAMGEGWTVEELEEALENIKPGESTNKLNGV